jgi:ATP-binding cassette subfamily B protein
MAKTKSSLFKDRKSRNLINRVLKENFHLYIRRYLLAFFLMGCTSLATALSVFMMKAITAVVFGSVETLKIVPEADTGTPALVAGWIQKINAYAASFFASAQPGMFQIFCVSIGIVLIFLVKGASSYGSSVILNKIGNNIVARQQRRVGNHILNQSLAFFVYYPSSELLSRVSQAASAARNVMNLLMTRVQDVFTAVALVIAMFKLDWRLSCAALFVLGPISILLGSIIRRVRRISRSQYKNFAQVISAFQEAIIGSKLIKSYNLEPSMRDRFGVAIGNVEKLSNKMAIVSSRTSPAMEFVGGIAVALIVFYGGYRNIVQGQSADSLIAFLTALLLAYEPVKRIAKMNVSLQSALVGVEMLYNVLDSDYSIRDAPDAQPLRLTRGGVSLHNVTFGYRQGSPVIHDLSLNCAGGQVTALVGPSGSGKSTVLNLVERFYQADAGRIEIDGQDISRIKTGSLRSHLSIVSQDTFLFSDTLRNNIRFARPDATDGEVEAAARAAFAHDFIMEQPQGYDTQVGENGGSLSGGQRQRISIARAFLKNAPILLLDEATSALDSESEQVIQKAFDSLMKGRTTIVIAHRFSTIRNADMIHVMRDGRLVASGPHEELIRDSEGLYAYLHSLQYSQEDRPSRPESCIHPLQS